MKMLYLLLRPAFGLAVLLLAACGGADPEATSPPAPKGAAPLRTAATADTADAAGLFAYAQQALPALFPGQPVTGQYGPYEYRFYPGSGNYLAFSGYEVFLLGPASGGNIQNVGTMQDYTCAAYPADCTQRVVRPSLAVQQTSFAPGVATSFIDTPKVVPLASPKAQGKTFFFRYNLPRAYAVGDIDGDGLDDIVVAPSFFNQRPTLPLEIWINQGNGTFANQTAALFDGAVPSIAFSGGVVLADFNHDGRLDIFVSDTGLEEYDCGTGDCPGAPNTLVLSQPGGKLKDVSSTHLGSNSARFHHVVTSVGDFNGDGHLDIAVPVLGNNAADGSGVLLWLNDGTGRFTEASAQLLPDEVGYRTKTYLYGPGFPAGLDRQEAGATALLDLDGDGRAELVTCSYLGLDRSGRRSVRVYSWNPALQRMAEVAKFQQPAVPAAAGLGCAGISAGDIDGDGRADLVLTWESWGETQVEVRRNLGNWQFEDGTRRALGSYSSSYYSGGFKWTAMGSLLRDLNGDGRPDLVHRAASISHAHLATGMPTALLNDGSGRFAPRQVKLAGNPVTEAGIVSVLQSQGWQTHLPLYGRFWPGNGPLDMALLNFNDVFDDFMQERRVVLRVLRAQ